MDSTAQSHLEIIFSAALRRADPYEMIARHLSLQSNRLEIAFENFHDALDLNQYERILLLGAGKAAPAMARAVEDVLGTRLEGGLISTKYGHSRPLRVVEQIEAGHPIPDENSLLAGRRMRHMAHSFTPRTLVINVISGGGSALLDGLLGYEEGGRSICLTLADLQAVTSALLACGATITEINTIRKHISTIKGGRFLQMLYPATSINLILSDVIGDRLDAIASGLTCADPTTFTDALHVLDQYAIRQHIPAAVLRALELGAQHRIPETPKPTDPVLARSKNILIGTLNQALLAAAAEARRLGYTPVVLTSQLTGEAREAGRFLLALARDEASHHLLAPLPACLIAGGETTVTLRGKGQGGRNQEMALAVLNEMAANPLHCHAIHFLSAATDGTDGPTHAAGAFASLELAQRAAHLGLDAAAALRENDSNTFFQALDALLTTGPTGTNVCDIQLALVRG